MYLIRVSHPHARDSFIRRWEEGIIGIVHDRKDATRFDNQQRVMQVVRTLTTEGRIEVEEDGQ